jgi:hypothetical protein
MEASLVNIDFKLMESAYRDYVREKAILAGSTIVYVKDGQLIEEDPKTMQKTILKKI